MVRDAAGRIFEALTVWYEVARDWLTWKKTAIIFMCLFLASCLMGCAVVEKAVNGTYDAICRSGTRDRC